MFNLPNQLSNWPNCSKNWGMQRGETEFHAFYELILPQFSYSRSDITIVPIPTIFTRKHGILSSKIDCKQPFEVITTHFGYIADLTREGGK